MDTGTQRAQRGQEAGDGRAAAGAVPSPRARFLQSEEGGVFLVGAWMLILWVLCLAALWRGGRPLWGRMLAMGFTHIVAGRAASIAQGTQMEMPRALIVLLATYMDTLCVFLVYPLLVYGYRHYVEDRFFKRHFAPLFAKARRHAAAMGRFKAVGVFLFVWFPMWMTGVIAGSVLGFLLGLRTWVNLGAVVLGTAAAVTCWVLAYDWLYGWLSGVGRALPMAVTLTTIGALVAARLLRFRRTRRRRAAGASGETEPAGR